MEGFTKFLESGGKEGGAPAGEDEDELDLDVSEPAEFLMGVFTWSILPEKSSPCVQL